MALNTLVYGTVSGRFIAAVADSPYDQDALPNAVPLTGHVIFTPSVRSVLINTDSEGPVTVALMPIKVTLDSQGYISHNGSRGIVLIASNNPTANPSNFTWSVAPTLSYLNTEVKLPAWNIEVRANQNTDLTTTAPVQSSTGTYISRGMTFTSVRQDGSSLIFTLEDGTDLAPVPSPHPGVFVQNNNPNMTRPGLWIQTGLGPDEEDFTFWIEDGVV